MEDHRDSGVPQEPSPLNLNLGSPLDLFPRSMPPDSLPLQHFAIDSFSQVTPQKTRSFAEDPQRGAICADGETSMLHNALSASASAQAQNFFIHSTPVLMVSFLKTPTPSDAEISRLATLTGLDKYGVSTWFDIIRSLLGDGGVKPPPPPELTQAFGPPISIYGNVSEDFLTPPIDLDLSYDHEDFPASSSPIKATRQRKKPSPSKSHPRRRRQKVKALHMAEPSLAPTNQIDLSQKDSAIASEEGHYFCPTCEFKTGKIDQWYTHQSRKHFPPEVFVCRIQFGTKPCNKGPDNPCKRKDNFATHLRESHGYNSGEALDQEVSRRTLKVTGMFHDRCGFCQMMLDNREASMEHIFTHIENGSKMNDWVHQCTSLDHKLKNHVHFEVPSDEPENNGWIQDGDFGHGNAMGFIEWDPDQVSRGAFGLVKRVHLPKKHTTAEKSPLSLRMDALRRCASPENLMREFSHVQPLISFTLQRSLGHGGFDIVFEFSHGEPANVLIGGVSWKPSDFGVSEHVNLKQKPLLLSEPGYDKPATSYQSKRHCSSSATYVPRTSRSETQDKIIESSRSANKGSFIGGGYCRSSTTYVPRTSFPEIIDQRIGSTRSANQETFISSGLAAWREGRRNTEMNDDWTPYQSEGMDCWPRGRSNQSPPFANQKSSWLGKKIALPRSKNRSTRSANQEWEQTESAWLQERQEREYWFRTVV